MSRESRLQVLSELERCQMPAVKKEGGGVQKTIEHYTFADASDSATIIIEADKDLYGGAAEHVKEEHIEVLSKDNELVVTLHGVPTALSAATRADWTLRLAPLCHSVESDRTSWKLRKGKISIKLTKRKPQAWKRAVKV
ncbi:Jmjd8 [Symbiodinium natans]|uniref:Jmjd8 protein n=1 Tax=Symbiodinium natans TaxID=878477 RepID=A0A812SUZ4_9DINO|nr:Jmjd8 [Symbiodinium natans]